MLIIIDIKMEKWVFWCKDIWLVFDIVLFFVGCFVFLQCFFYLIDKLMMEIFEVRFVIVNLWQWAVKFYSFNFELCC